MQTHYFTVTDLETGKKLSWSLREVLEEINGDRSEDWTDYDESDFVEGWEEWIEGDFYSIPENELDPHR